MCRTTTPRHRDGGEKAQLRLFAQHDRAYLYQHGARRRSVRSAKQRCCSAVVQPELGQPEQARPDLGQPELGQPELAQPKRVQQELAPPKMHSCCSFSLSLRNRNHERPRALRDQSECAEARHRTHSTRISQSRSGPEHQRTRTRAAQSEWGDEPDRLQVGCMTGRSLHLTREYVVDKRLA